jgi:hypothetical protein
LRFLIGLYSVFIDDLLQIFPRRQLLLIRSEDYDAAPRKVLQGIATFLDIGLLILHAEIKAP